MRVSHTPAPHPILNPKIARCITHVESPHTESLLKQGPCTTAAPRLVRGFHGPFFGPIAWPCFHVLLPTFKTIIRICENGMQEVNYAGRKRYAEINYCCILYEKDWLLAFVKIPHIVQVLACESPKQQQTIGKTDGARVRGMQKK